MDAVPPIVPPEIVGCAEHYSQFIRLCRLRIEQLGVPFETIDTLAGFPERYVATLLSGSGGKAMSVFSFFTLARTLALLPAFHHDERQLADLRARPDWVTWRRPGKRWRPRRPKPRKRAQGHARRVEFTLWPDLLRKSAQQGGFARAAKMTEKERSESARRAALARWGKSANGSAPQPQ